MYSFERVYFFSADGNGYRDKLIRYLLNDGRKTLYKNYANIFTVRALQVATHLVNATKICAQYSCILCTVYRVPCTQSLVKKVQISFFSAIGYAYHYKSDGISGLYFSLLYNFRIFKQVKHFTRFWYIHGFGL